MRLWKPKCLSLKAIMKITRGFYDQLENRGRITSNKAPHINNFQWVSVRKKATFEKEKNNIKSVSIKNFCFMA